MYLDRAKPLVRVSKPVSWILMYFLLSIHGELSIHGAYYYYGTKPEYTKKNICYSSR